MTISKLMPLAVAVCCRVFSTQWIAASVIPVVVQGMAGAAVVNANFTSATTIPVTAASYTATGNTVNLALGFAPSLGTNLTAINNTGLDLIQGTFDNLAQGERVNLAFNGILYPFVANYLGGTGNDLILEWGNTRLVTWGNNGNGQLGACPWMLHSPAPVAADLAGNLNGAAVAIAAGWTHSMALGSDGSLFAWGGNTSQQLGIGLTIDQFKPVAVRPAGGLLDKRVVAFDTGSAHSLALREDGVLVAWGRATSGQMGTATNANSMYPDSPPVTVDMTGVLSGKMVLAIAAGGSHNLALCEGGLVAAWGANSSGQTGNGSGSNQLLPVWVSPTGGLAGKVVAAIAAGGSHSMALNTDGSLAAWGYNMNGQLGDGTTTHRTTPVVVNRSGVLAGKTVRAIAAGSEHSLALCSDGTLAAWGKNSSGQLGDGTTNHRSIPVLVNQTGVLAGKTVVAIAAGNKASLALCGDGSIAAWGNNGSGQLGDDTTVSRLFPVLVQSAVLTANGGVPTKISMGAHALALVAIAPPPVVETLAATGVGNTTATLNGTVNANGSATTIVFEYGPTSAYGSTITAAPAAASGTTATAVRAAPSGLAGGATYHYRVVATGGGGTVFGADQTFTTADSAALAGLALDSGVLVPTFDPKRTTYAVAVDGDISATTVTPTALHAGATVKVNGGSVVPGAASPAIPLAEGNNPVTVEVTGTDGLTQVYEVVVTRLPETLVLGSATAAPVTVTGFSAAGRTAKLALEFAPPVGATLPVVNNTGTGPIQGKYSNLAQNQVVTLAYQGVDYPWLANYQGGDGNDLVLEWANRRVVAWGNNVAGQLGDGSTTRSTVPVAVADALLAGKVITTVGTGYRDSMALCADGTLAVWGNKIYGSLGDGTTGSRKTPIDISRNGVLAGHTIIGVANGFYHGMAWCADGTLAGWGDNSNGQIGTSAPNASVPVWVDRSGVLAGKTIKSVACGVYHTLALCTDGTLAAWGANTEGQLGFRNSGYAFNWSRPVLTGNSGILEGKTITAIAAGDYFSMALCADGTLAIWGNPGLSSVGTGDHPQFAAARPVNSSGVLAGKAITAIAAGRHHAMALCADGTLAEFFSLTPALVNTSGVLAGKTVTGIACGRSGKYVICSDGSLVTWLASAGSVVSPPVLVPGGVLASGEGFMRVASGEEHVLAITARPPAPTVQTLAATHITDNSATLVGTVGANGSTTTVSIEYGTTTNDGTLLPGAPATADGTTPVTATAAIANLIPGTTYHYRVIAQNAGGVVKGADGTFTTTDLATLASLAPGSGTLRPGFDSKQMTYGITVPYAAAGLSFTPVAAHAAAEVRVNGEAVASGAASQELPLTVGNTPVTVAVTGASGQTLSYQIEVTRLPETLLFAAANTVPVTAGGFEAVGAAAFALDFQPSPGTVLTVVNNTGASPIIGRFSNLRQWQTVGLSYGGVTYQVVADYFGGTGNDLVLRWGHQRLLAWGYNGSGQLGDGTMVHRYAPVAADILLNNGRTVAAVAISGSHSLALRSDGVLFAWGGNQYGQLGTGGTSGSSVPVPVDTGGALAGRTIISLAAEADASYALCDDGVLFAWGLGYGVLPVRVPMSGVLAGRTVAGIAAGGNHSLVLCRDGTLAAWGKNWDGQLGDGTKTTSSTPVLVSRSGVLEGKEVVAIAAGSAHSMALCADGTLAAWGDGLRGQVGSTEPHDGVGDYLVPVAVSRAGVLAGKTVKAIAAQSSHNLALCSDGTLVSWGDNRKGQLGNDSTSNAAVPVMVSTSGVLAGKTVNSIAAGYDSCLALCTDGTLAAWGYNYAGKLGDGTTTNRATPVRVLNGALETGQRFSALGGLTSHALAIAATPPPPPPVFSGYAIGTPFQTAATVALQKLLAKASDPDGDTIFVTAAGPASANGGTVALLADSIRYTPPNGFTGADTFTVTLTDEGGASVDGTVTVDVGPGPNMGGIGSNPPVLTVLPDGKVGIAFQGIPGRSYTVQRSVGGLDDWETLATLTADAAGRVAFTDDNPPPGSAFYRLGMP